MLSQVSQRLALQFAGFSMSFGITAQALQKNLSQQTPSHHCPGYPSSLQEPLLKFGPMGGNEMLGFLLEGKKIKGWGESPRS